MKQSDRSSGLVCTFYSYKGGVGRSMALANVAALLSRYGRKVLVVDWDLEAPGLEKFFGKHLLGSRVRTPGLLELVTAQAGGERVAWRDCLLTVAIPQGERIAILHAGRDDPRYVERLRALDWDALFREKDLGRALDALREEWISEYDFVLIDSRTGITDIGGICSILMPDYLVCLFTTNEQSVVGVKQTMARARTAHADLPLDRRRLLVVPVPARDESNTEYKLALEWRARFARELSEFYTDWIPSEETPERVLDYLKIPYVAYWSFGEKLPVLEEDPENPKKLAFSYAVLARLIASKLDWDEVKEGRQAAEAEAAQRVEAERKAAEAVRIREEAQRLRQENDRREAEAADRRLDEVSDRVRARHADLIHRRLVMFQRHQRVMWMLLIAAGVSLAVKAGLEVSDRFKMAVVDVLGFGNFQQLASLQIVLFIITLGCVAGAMWCFFGRRLAAAAIERLEREETAFAVHGGAYDRLSATATVQAFASRIEDAAALDSLWPWKSLKSVSSSTVTTPSYPPVPPNLPASGGPAPLPSSSGPVPPAHEPSAPRPASAATPPTERVLGGGMGQATAPRAAGDETIVRLRVPADVVLSYTGSSLTRAWLREFLPLFESWVAEYLGRTPVVLAPVEVLSSDATEAALHDLLEPSGVTAVGIVVVSGAYAKSKSAMTELAWLMERLGPLRIFPVVLDRDVDMPPTLRELQSTDLSDFAFVGEGFSKTERYVDFQSVVRSFARRVADSIEANTRAASLPA